MCYCNHLLRCRVTRHSEGMFGVLRHKVGILAECDTRGTSRWLQTYARSPLSKHPCVRRVRRKQSSWCSERIATPARTVSPLAVRCPRSESTRLAIMTDWRDKEGDEHHCRSLSLMSNSRADPLLLRQHWRPHSLADL
jgi:hypothetical protein